MLGLFQRWILPGFIFQSAMIGGGYATGRELVEFFLLLGPQSAIVAVLVATVAISLISGVAFEFARRFSLYDYRLFFKRLLGPAWILFEVIYISMMLLVLAVIGSASGELIGGLLAIPQYWGGILLMTIVGLLLFYGSTVIERFLSGWSLVLYLAYGLLVVMSFLQFEEEIINSLVNAPQPSVGLGALKSGLTYAGYNAIVFTAILFVVRHFRRKSDAVIAGALCGPLSMIPAILLLVAMFAHYPEVNDTTLPISYLLSALQAPKLMIFFNIVIFGTFIETGAALLHSVNERILGLYKENNRLMPGYVRPLTAFLMLTFSIYLAELLGLVTLISKGYTYFTYAFFVIVIIPLMTRGVYLMVNHKRYKEPCSGYAQV